MIRPYLLTITLLAAAACSREQPAADAPAAQAPAGAAPSGAAPAPAGGAAAISDAARTEAQQIFSSRCTPCHGAQGAGDGPASAGLQPPPRNFQLADWQASVTDEHIEKIIKFGGPAVGKSAAMPPNPDLMSKPEVVAALREHIRSLKQ